MFCSIFNYEVWVVLIELKLSKFVIGMFFECIKLVCNFVSEFLIRFFD